MAVSIKIGDEQQDLQAEPPVSEPIATVSLNIRKTMDGDIMIFDHADIDIIIMKKKQKIVAFPKDIMSEVVYGAQDRLFKFLMKKGMIELDSVVGGSVYGSIQANMLQSEEYNNVTLAIINIEKWIDSERPYFEFIDDVEELQADRLTDPSDEESTELGEVPHEETKGTLRPGYNYGPYYQSYTYE
tara:strand:- start:139 stop:696 length:558 start_codon:yes stop_codon:yes gene_type:complete